MKRLLLLPLLLTLVQAEVVLEPLHVTGASNSDQLLAERPENITIITAEDLEKTHAGTLTEALSRLAGIAFSSNGGMGTSTSFYLRGFDSKRTLVLIDGVRYNDPAGLSGAEFQHIVLDEIERIEIIKGAQSGIWGADASAGVINIITKSAGKGSHLYASTELGSYGLQKTSVSLSNKGELLDFKLTSSQLNTYGFSASEPKYGDADYGKRGSELGYEADEYRNNTVNLSLGAQLTDKDRLEAKGRYINSFINYDLSSGDATTENSTGETLFYAFDYRHTEAKNQANLSYSKSSFNRDIKSTWGDGLYIGNVEESTLKDSLDYSENAELTLGYVYQKFEINEYGSALINRLYDNHSAYLSNSNKLGSLILNESLRYDRYSDFDNTFTGKLGLKYNVNSDIFITTNYGTGYNAPTIYQLYGPYGANTDLKPELTSSSDLTIGNQNFTLSYFYNEIKDLIDWDGGYSNIAGISTLQGVEASFKDTLFDRLELGMDYTYLDAQDANGLYLVRRPKHQGNLRVTYLATEDFSLLTHIHYTGSRFNDSAQTIQTGEYALVNLVANYTLDKNLKTYIKVDNLFDTFYQVVDGYATAGLSAYIGLNASY